MKCVVTGGAGFIGSHVVDELIRQRHEVVVIDDESGGFARNVNPRATWIRRSTMRVSTHILRGAEVVFHLAGFAAEGLSVYAPTLNATSNFAATSRLVALCVESGVRRVVFTSSIAVYGDQGGSPFDESMPLRPTDPYGIAKVACEQLLRFYSSRFGIEHTVVRLQNVYGRRQSLADPYRNVVGIFIRDVLEGKPMALYGGGLQTRAFTHVADVVPCIVRAGLMRELANRDVNVGAATLTTVKDLGLAIAELAGTSPTFRHFASRIGDSPAAYFDATLARELLRFDETWDLRSGLSDVLEWARTLEMAIPRWRRHDVEINRRLPANWIEDRDERGTHDA